MWVGRDTVPSMLQRQQPAYLHAQTRHSYSYSLSDPPTLQRQQPAHVHAHNGPQPQSDVQPRLHAYRRHSCGNSRTCTHTAGAVVATDPTTAMPACIQQAQLWQHTQPQLKPHPQACVQQAQSWPQPQPQLQPHLHPACIQQAQSLPHTAAATATPARIQQSQS